ncbi:MAG: hypothetical protein IPG68_00955 [Micrococcales bacterium]|nr:hypothetical protein [Micrococcales bacterium]
MTDRRHVLQVGMLATVTLVALPACTDEPGSQPTAPAPTPDELQAAEMKLIAAYDAALGSAGNAAQAQYQRIRDDHAAHLRALGWTAEPTPDAATERPPGRRALRRAEVAASKARARAAVAATDAEQAQILALIAASEAQHVATLDAL